MTQVITRVFPTQNIENKNHWFYLLSGLFQQTTKVGWAPKKIALSPITPDKPFSISKALMIILRTDLTRHLAMGVYFNYACGVGKEDNDQIAVSSLVKCELHAHIPGFI